MTKQEQHFYEFGPFRLDVAERRLLRDGNAIPLTSKVFDTLLVLVENRGHALDKEEMLKKLWPDAFVDEGNLSQNISILRKALGESTNDTRYIETIPRRGYRFIADVRESAGRRFQMPRRSVLAAGIIAVAVTAGAAFLWIRNPFGREVSPGIRSLAVLPFVTLQAGPEEDQLGLGIADGVITRVSQVNALTVRPTGAIRKYASRSGDPLESARELRVDSVLAGTLQRAGNQLRVSVNLLRTHDGASLWAESFDVPVTDFFAVQDEVGRQIVRRLSVSLTATERDRLGRRDTSSIEAYQYYVKAMKPLSDVRKGSVARPALESAIALLQKAVEIDPHYARARAQLAHVYVRMGSVVDLDSSWIERGEEQLRQAQSLDPLLAEVHVVRHWVLCSGFGGFRMEEAIRELELARQLNPSVGRSELGMQYAHLGLEDLAVRELERSIEIDPISEMRQSFLSEGYRLLGRTDEAIARHEQFWNQPGPVPALISKRRLEEAEPIISRELAQNPDGPYEIGSRALSLALRGKFTEAEALIPSTLRLRKNPSYHHATHSFAALYALQGKAQLAVKWLRETADTGMPSYLLFTRDSDFDSIRKDPAFIQFMAELRTQWEGYRNRFH